MYLILVCTEQVVFPCSFFAQVSLRKFSEQVSPNKFSEQVSLGNNMATSFAQDMHTVSDSRFTLAQERFLAL